MADRTVTKDVSGETTGVRNRTGKGRNAVRRLVFWLSACLIFVAVISGGAYAQQFKYEPCKLCNGTGKNLCKNCGGNRCQVCNFSGVQENPACLLVGCGRFDCAFCKGSGKSKVDTRFEHCFRTFFDGENGYLCPDNHPIGRVVIVDKWDSGKILKKYTKAEWDKKEADERAEKVRLVEEERARKEELAAERARQEAEQEAERVKAETERLKRVKPQIEHLLKHHFVLVNGGSFQMGCSKGDKECVQNENPVHSVAVSDFYIGKYEITLKLWELVMGTNPYETKEIDRQHKKSKSKEEMERQIKILEMEKQLKKSLLSDARDNLPVVNVCWNDVQEFIQKLNSITGKKYRLPTEAEWEYAARGGAMNKGYVYSGNKKPNEVAWYDENSGSMIKFVGTKSPNELGIYDMSGNVAEWVNDWFGIYGSNAQTNPTGPSSGSHRVFRGGGWNYAVGFCRVSYRGIDNPDHRSYDVGFRLAISP